MTKKVNRNPQNRRNAQKEPLEKRPVLQTVGMYFACYLIMALVFTVLLFISTGVLNAGGVILLFLAAYPTFMWQKGRFDTAFVLKFSAMTGVVASLAMTILLFMQR